MAEFVENKRELVRLVEYKGRIYQKCDPVYLDPEERFVRAHFYAPQKYLIGGYLSTFWVNILVMWFMAAGFGLILYYRLLKRFVDKFENRGRKVVNE